MRNKTMFIALPAMFALVLMWLHQCVERGAMSDLKDLFQFGPNWLNWSVIGSIAAFIAATVLGFAICELLPRSSRLIASLLLPLVSVYVVCS